MTHDDTLSYQNALPRTSRWAVGVFCASLAAAVGFFLIVPPILTMLGSIIIQRILAGRTDVEGQGLAKAAVRISGYSILLGLGSILFWPSMGCSRCLAASSVCAANLRGTMQSLNVYSADFNDAYPVVSPAGGYALAAGGTGTPNPDATVTLNSLYVAPSPSVTQNMWILVLTGQVSPKQFICKSDPSPLVSASATDGKNYLTNFNDGSGKPSDFAYSYSFAYPWQAGTDNRVGSWWKNQTDASLPLMADMAPLNGTGTPGAVPGDPTSQYANSFNHERQGQNVGYGDAHAEFARTPTVGQNGDNIYTFNGGVTSKTGVQFAGSVPGVGNGGVTGNYDICMVPAVDGVTHARR